MHPRQNNAFIFHNGEPDNPALFFFSLETGKFALRKRIKKGVKI